MPECRNRLRDVFQGDTIKWTECLSNCPAGGFSFQAIFSKNGNPGPVAAGSVNAEGGIDFVLPATDSAGLEIGDSLLVIIASNPVTGERRTIRSMNLFVRPNPAVAMKETGAQAQLRILNQALESLTGTDMKSVSALGQTYTKEQITFLQNARDRAQARVDAEMRALGLSKRGGSKILQTFFRN